MRTIIVLLLFFPLVSNAQITKRDSLWLPFKYFEGKWTGESEGQPGKGTHRAQESSMSGKGCALIQTTEILCQTLIETC